MDRKRQFKVYISNNPVNKNKSTNPLVHLKYRQLQKLAIKLMLPANIKHKLLLALIIARTSNREDIVDVITKELLLKGKGSEVDEYVGQAEWQNCPTETYTEEFCVIGPTLYQNTPPELDQSVYCAIGDYNSSDTSNSSSTLTATCGINTDDTNYGESAAGKDFEDISQNYVNFGSTYNGNY